MQHDRRKKAKELEEKRKALREIYNNALPLLTDAEGELRSVLGNLVPAGSAISV